MKIAGSLIPVTVLLCASPSLHAQSFDYPDFSSIAGLSLVRLAAQNGTEMQVHNNTTTNGDLNRGAVWFDQPVNVVGGFETTFVFNINGLISGGGDGMAFVIQNEQIAGDTGGVGITGIGRHASACGYGLFTGSAAGESVDISLVIELDTFAGTNAPILDPDGNHISIHTGGTGDNGQNESFSIGRAESIDLGASLKSGQDHTVRIVYVPGTLEVYFNVNLVITTAYDFANGGTWIDSALPVGGLDLIGGTSAFVGFTASSGGARENHDLISWSFGPPTGSFPSFCNGDGGDQMVCTPCPCGNDGTAGTVGGCLNGVGGNARLIATGSASIAADTLRMEVTEAGSQTFAILVSGPNLLPNMGACPPGSGLSPATLDGLRCVGGGVTRHGTRASDINGDIGVTNNGWGTPSGPVGGLVAQTGAAAGQTRHFQCFYREMPTAGCGTGQNTTQAVSVTFL